jgi:membrane protein YdbS with pleckstrin-like domain
VTSFTCARCPDLHGTIDGAGIDSASVHGADQRQSRPGGLMGISTRRLGPDEHVVAYTRSHWKALVVPVLVLITTCAVTGFLLAAALTKVGRPLAWIVLAAAVLVIGRFVVRPFLRWLSASYTVTNRRILLRSGVVRRSARDVPLQSIADVRSERGLLDRLLGCGTLIVSDASEFGRSVLSDVPRIQALQLTIADLIYANRSRTGSFAGSAGGGLGDPATSGHSKVNGSA